MGIPLGINGTTVGGATKAVVVNSNGRLGTAPEPSASATSLMATVRGLTTELERQQRQIEQLREQLKGG